MRLAPAVVRPTAAACACRKALESFSARQLRLMFLLQPWHKGMVYGEQSANEMRSRETQIKNFFQNIDAAVRAVNVNATEQRWEVGWAGRGGGGAAAPIMRAQRRTSRLPAACVVLRLPAGLIVLGCVPAVGHQGMPR